MPTDGADFGRIKACYGKAFTAARIGASESDVAEIAVAGVERDIRHAGGAPSFQATIDLLVEVTKSPVGGRERLLAGVDAINREFGAASFTRYVSSAAETLGLECLRKGSSPSRDSLAALVLGKLIESRCCDGITPYITRNRTQSVAESGRIVTAIKEHVRPSGSLSSLASRMLNGSAKGLPEKAPKASRVSHVASDLRNEVIGSA